MSTQLDTLRRHVAERPAPPPESRGRALVVGSGRGGVGTSLVASLVALGAAAGGASVLLVDGDAGLGSLHFLFGVDPGAGVEPLRRGEAAPGELVVPVTDRLALLPASPLGSTLSGVERQTVFRRLSSLYARYDVVVVDGGSRLDSVVAAAAGAAGVLLAATTDRIALTSTYAMVKVLAERLPALPVEVLVNRADPEQGRHAADEVRAAARHFLERHVGFAASVPEDDCLHRAIQAGMPLTDAAVGSPAATRLADLAARWLAR